MSTKLRQKSCRGLAQGLGTIRACPLLNVLNSKLNILHKMVFNFEDNACSLFPSNPRLIEYQDLVLKL